jgi:hypothetical protein
MRSPWCDSRYELKHALQHARSDPAIGRLLVRLSFLTTRGDLANVDKTHQHSTKAACPVFRVKDVERNPAL